jgi:hypothetical protein
MRIIISEDQYKRIIKENSSLQDKILKTINRIGLLKTIETIGYESFKKMIPINSIDRDKKIDLINFICNYEDDIIYFYDIMYHDIVLSEEPVDEGISVETIYSIENRYVNVKTTIYNEEGEIVADTYERGYLILTNKLDNNIIDIIFDSLIKYYFEITTINEGLINESSSLQDKLIKTIDRIGLIKTLKSVGYKTFINILPEYFNDRDKKIDVIKEITEDGFAIYEVFDSDIEIERYDEDDFYEIDYITYIEGEDIFISTYRYDGAGNQIDEPWDSFTINIYDLKHEIIDSLFDSIGNKFFK